MRASAVAGIIFANSHDELLNKLTSVRSMASVPFGGRYRLIDFSLSNLINARVNNVGIITKENYRSLMDHIGSGAAWDLDRKNGGIHILPPYNISGARRYHGYIEALYGAKDFIRRSNADYIVICESNIVANIDISAAFEAHIANDADVTVVYHNSKFPKDHPDTMVLSLDDTSRITKIDFADVEGEVCDHSIGTLIISRHLLTELIADGYSSEAYSVSRDILAPKVSSLRIYGFEHKGFAIAMDSGKTYFEANMALLDSQVRKDLFKARPVFTKTRDDMPTRYGTKADVNNCFIADGCVIEGTVKNSVLFRGVTVKKGAVVENSILMQGVTVDEATQLDYVISDKNAKISGDMVLKGTNEKPFLIKKNQEL